MEFCMSCGLNRNDSSIPFTRSIDYQHLQNDDLSILFPVSFGSMRQIYWVCISNKNNTL